MIKISLTKRFNTQNLTRRLKILFNGPSLDERPNVYCARKPDKNEIPDHWEYKDFHPAGIPTGIVRANSAHDEVRTKITYFLGFKARAKDYNTPQVRALQRMGCEIDFVPLPDPGKQTGYLQDYKKIVRDTLLSSNQGTEQAHKIPHFIFGHSLGGRAIIANMLHEDFAEHVRDNFAGIILVSPHIASPYKSKPLVNALYSTYCRIFHDVSYPNAPFDRFFAGNTKKEGKNTPLVQDENAITHGQIDYSNRETRDLMGKIERHHISEHASLFPMLMIGGTQDFVSSKEEISIIAETFDADFLEFDVGHNAFISSKDARTAIWNTVTQWGEDWLRVHAPDRFAHIEDNQVTYSPLEDPMPNWS